ncbi:MAG: HAD family phosphatase [Tissierellia bacterium]|nr:HAD family phosphatase [Tissierellia bacterium]
MDSIKAMIFDADGVLLDSMELWDQLSLDYLTSQGISGPENLNDIMFSMSYREGCQYLKDHFLPSKTVEEIDEDLKNRMEDFYFKIVNAKEGVADFLAFLQEKNYPMVIVTSTEERLVRGALKRLQLEEYFLNILSAPDLQTSKREAPIFLQALEILGTKGKNTFLVEDALYSIETGKSIGLKIIGVYDRFNEEEQEEIRKQSHFYIKTARDWEKIKEEL